MRSNAADDRMAAVRTLKPCPFCGGNAELAADRVKMSFETYIKQGYLGELFAWRVRCTGCGAQFPSVDDAAVRDEDGIRLTVDGRKRTMDMWNRRVVG